MSFATPSKPIIWIGFVLASFMAVAQSALMPGIPLLAFAPFIALVCMHTSSGQALWLSALAGLCNDLLNVAPPGIYAINATIVCALLIRFRLRTFKDEPLQLCFYTAIISAATVPVHYLLLFLFDQQLFLAGKSILIEFVEMVFVNALYAFGWFVGPLLLWEWGSVRWKRWRLQRNGP